MLLIDANFRLTFEPKTTNHKNEYAVKYVMFYNWSHTT